MVLGDGELGCSNYAPFDSTVVTVEARRRWRAGTTPGFTNCRPSCATPPYGTAAPTSSAVGVRSSPAGAFDHPGCTLDSDNTISSGPPPADVAEVLDAAHEGVHPLVRRRRRISAFCILASHSPVSELSSKLAM
ncbi:hypothetical protein [Nonomuraea ceibae]|uniref:hypothetical protein n=1 Tax=Nonomuraea ceibae TaxID=1935170 RepID=UPI001C5CE5FE|nr:hypothetical protein [Nonomuraea ceibae]